MNRLDSGEQMIMFFMNSRPRPDSVHNTLLEIEGISGNRQIGREGDWVK